MFQVLRQWWGRGRVKVTARLLLLELLVVVLGVFIAQALADLNNRRNALASMERAKSKADRDLAVNALAAAGWERAIPCLDARMTAIMRTAGQAAPIDAQLTKRPAMQSMGLQLPSESEHLLLADRHGAKVADTYSSASSNADSLTDLVDDVVRAWAGLALIDPANGPPGERDRHAAREAAAQIKAALRGMEINATNVRERAETLGIQPRRDGPFRMIRDCDDLWSTGMTHPTPAADRSRRPA